MSINTYCSGHFSIYDRYIASERGAAFKEGSRSKNVLATGAITNITTRNLDFLDPQFIDFSFKNR